MQAKMLSQVPRFRDEVSASNDITVSVVPRSDGETAKGVEQLVRIDQWYFALPMWLETIVDPDV